MPAVVLEGQRVEYSVRRSARARSARVVARAWQPLEVVLPRRAPESAAERLLRRHAAWVVRNAARVPPLPPLADGAEVVVRGAPHRLRLHEGRGGTVRDGVVDLALAQPGDPTAVRDCLERLLRREARSDLIREADRSERVLGVERSSLAVRDQRSRWGSCSTSGTLSFNWRLVLAPHDVLDYVVVHEICHLLEMNHGPDFWALVQRRRPGYHEPKAWLDEHGWEILAYRPPEKVAA
jgi:hypothetical protein